MRSLSLKNLVLIMAVGAGGFVLGRFAVPSRNEATGATTISHGDRATSPSSAASVAGGIAASQKRSFSQTTAQVRLALQAIDKKAPCDQREEERLKLIQALAATDPLGAMEYAKQNLKRDRLAQAMASIATEWARHDPAAAWSWACSRGPEEVYHSHTVLEQVSRDNPEQAARFASEFAQKQPEEAVAMTLTAMRGMTEGGNFEGARKLANDLQLRSEEEKGVLLNFMAGQWARHEPEKAAQWVQSLPEGPLRNQALIGLGESWGEVDPPKAANFAAQLPAGEQRQLALKQAISNWILNDPAEASIWVNSFDPSPDFDQAVASVATMRFLMEEHIDTALSWANSIYDSPLKIAALSEIVSYWSTHDHAGAVNYVKTVSSLTPEARQQLLKQLQPGTD
ncbi:MAG: hypothetical protein H7Y43_02325 [Akkermansiaceae bacterium]|nr:hypothetical protein [Verrucomicrobiales bacterium]